MEKRASYPVCLWMEDRLTNGGVDVVTFLRALADHAEGCPGCRWRVGQLMIRHVAVPGLVPVRAPDVNEPRPLPPRAG